MMSDSAAKRAQDILSPYEKAAARSDTDMFSVGGPGISVSPSVDLSYQLPWGLPAFPGYSRLLFAMVCFDLLVFGSFVDLANLLDVEGCMDPHKCWDSVGFCTCWFIGPT